jgi:hypothetical protein
MTEELHDKSNVALHYSMEKKRLAKNGGILGGLIVQFCQNIGVQVVQKSELEE